MYSNRGLLGSVMLLQDSPQQKELQKCLMVKNVWGEAIWLHQGRYSSVVFRNSIKMGNIFLKLDDQFKQKKGINVSYTMLYFIIRENIKQAWEIVFLIIIVSVIQCLTQQSWQKLQIQTMMVLNLNFGSECKDTIICPWPMI